MSVYGPITTPNSTGGAGVSTSNADSAQIIKGFVVGVYVQYNGAPPAATTDVTIKTKGLSGTLPSYNILVITNAATDGFFAPQIAGVKSTDGTASGQYGKIYIEDYINVTIAQANDNDGVTVWIYTV